MYTFRKIKLPGWEKAQWWVDEYNRKASKDFKYVHGKKYMNGKKIE